MSDQTVTINPVNIIATEMEKLHMSQPSENDKTSESKDTKIENLVRELTRVCHIARAYHDGHKSFESEHKKECDLLKSQIDQLKEEIRILQLQITNPHILVNELRATIEQLSDNNSYLTIMNKSANDVMSRMGKEIEYHLAENEKLHKEIKTIQT